MSTSNEMNLAEIRGAVFGDVKKNWGWLLALGIVSLILGTLGFYMTFALTLASVLFFGILILGAGVLQLVHAFTCKGWKSVLWHVLIALLYIAAGIDIILDPARASVVLTLVLAGILIAVGVMRILMAFQLRPVAAGWFWPLLSGLVSILLGGMIIAEWPVSGLWVIGLFVAIELVFSGWSTVFVALAARRAAQEDAVKA
ncbi:HdeD family acid-resistance protein [Thiorhodococcus mannitoliphagus]